MCAVFLPGTRGAETLYFNVLRPVLGNVKARVNAPTASSTGFGSSTSFSTGTTAPSSFGTTAPSSFEREYKCDSMAGGAN